MTSTWIDSPGSALLEQLHLAGFPLAGPPQAGQSEVAKHALNRAHGQPHAVHALQPEPRTSSPIAEVLTGLANQLDGRGGHPPRPVSRIGRHQSLNAPALPPLPPPPNRPSTEPVVATRGTWPVRLRVLQNEQAIAHPRPILRPNLHVAELDHEPPLVWPAWTSAAHQNKGVNLE